MAPDGSIRELRGRIDDFVNMGFNVINYSVVRYIDQEYVKVYMYSAQFNADVKIKIYLGNRSVDDVFRDLKLHQLV